MSTKNSLIQIPYLSSGRPCPFVLTGDEVIEFLGLDGNNPKRTLKFYRDEGLLIGFRLGHSLRYRLIDVLEFLERKAAKRN